MLSSFVDRLHSVAAETALSELLSASIEVTGAQFGNIQIADWSVGCLSICAHRGFTAEFLDFFKCVTMQDRCACGSAMRTKAAVGIKDIMDAGALSTRVRNAIFTAGVRAVQSIPMSSSSGAGIGIVSVHFSRIHSITPAELQRLTALATATADRIISHRSKAKGADRLCADATKAIVTSRELIRRIDPIHDPLK